MDLEQDMIELELTPDRSSTRRTFQELSKELAPLIRDTLLRCENNGVYMPPQSNYQTAERSDSGTEISD